MTNEEARKVLEESGATVHGGILHGFSRSEIYPNILPDGLDPEKAGIADMDDCWLTADELEAIAMWMRDPEGVIPTEKSHATE